MSKTKKPSIHVKRTHRVWQLQEAKAHFSELINEVEEGSYHTITKNGRPVAIVISKTEFEKTCQFKNSLLDFFRESPLSDLDLDIKRNKDFGRDIVL